MFFQWKLWKQLTLVIFLSKSFWYSQIVLPKYFEAFRVPPVKKCLDTLEYVPNHVPHIGSISQVEANKKPFFQPNCLMMKLVKFLVEQIVRPEHFC